jgi:hypothetical protein
MRASLFRLFAIVAAMVAVLVLGVVWLHGGVSQWVAIGLFGALAGPAIDAFFGVLHAEEQVYRDKRSGV